MASRFALALSVLLASVVGSHDAAANGRPPGTSTINFRRGMEQHIVAGMTFGLLLSRDNGQSWSWMCEEAIGYGGMYDPDYVFTSTDSLFATTFNGLKVARDACTFQGPNGTKFVSTVTQGPNGWLYYASADTPAVGNPGDAKIYRSTDDGATWPLSSEAGVVGDWWESLEVAPSDPNRLYLAGYRYNGSTKTFLLFRSDDAAVSWDPLPVTDFITMSMSSIDIVGIAHNNPDLVFARVKGADNQLADAIYRSTNGGTSWEKILDKPGAISFVVRRSGELVAATQAHGAARSTNNGGTWTDLVSPPHINCLAENSAGEVWACTQNYGGMQAPSDGHGIMKSTDLASWTPVLKFQRMSAPITCGNGTVQRERCDKEMWCGLCSQLGCDSGRPECEPLVDTSDGGGSTGGCCFSSSTTPAPGALLLLTLGVGVLLLRPRRR